MQLLAAALSRGDEARLFQHAQVLHHAEPRHRDALAQLAQRLPVALEESIEQLAAARIGERFEHLVHSTSYM